MGFNRHHPGFKASVALHVLGSDEDPAEVVSRASHAGAVAVLMHNTDWKNYRVRIAQSDIPFATMNAEAAEMLRGPGEVTVNFQVNRYETSQNVIASRTHPGHTDESKPIAAASIQVMCTEGT